MPFSICPIQFPSSFFIVTVLPHWQHPALHVACYTLNSTQFNMSCSKPFFAIQLLTWHFFPILSYHHLFHFLSPLLPCYYHLFCYQSCLVVTYSLVLLSVSCCHFLFGADKSISHLGLILLALGIDFLVFGKHL